MTLPRTVAFCCLVTLAAGNCSAATLWGVTGDGSPMSESLYTISTVDASITFQTALGNGDDGEGIAYNPNDGLLYHTSGISSSEQYMETVDPTSLAVGPNLAGGTYGPDMANEIFAIEWYQPLGVFLVGDLDANFYHVTTGGSFTLVGDHGGVNMRGFAVVGSQVFGVSPFDPFLYEVIPTDGSVLNTLPLTLDGMSMTATGNGLATDPDTGIVYAIMKETVGGPAPRVLATIDITTGVATSVGVLNGQKFSGITFVPEPASALLLLAGMLSLFLRRR